MSRGHGRIQLQVLEFLLRFDEGARARGDLNAYAAILDIAGAGASRSRVESVRRAAKSLADEGLILLAPDAGERSASRAGQPGSVHHSRGLMARYAAPAGGQHRGGGIDGDSELSA